MKNNTIKKINSFGTAGYVISVIGKVAFIIAVVACLVCAVLMCFMPSDAVLLDLSTQNSAVLTVDDSMGVSQMFDFGAEEGIIQIGGNSYAISTDSIGEPIVTNTVIDISLVKWVFFAGVFASLAVFVAFCYASKLCKSFKNCETPFTTEISNTLMKLAWSLIPAVILSGLMESLVESLVTGTFDLLISIDLVTVLLILCIFMLSFIFKHGTQLQTDIDETL